MNRRFFLKYCGFGLGATFARFGRCQHHLSGDLPAGQVHTKPNIVLYVVDDQGMGDAGCYGHPAIETPALDALAKEGVVFDNAFCTSASCSPSRSVILTGKHNHSTGQYGLSHWVYHFSTFSDVKSLPVLLSDAGYRTACYGKFHVAPREVYRFDTYAPLDRPEVMADRCEQYITADKSRPFFLYFCTMEPHRPFPRDESDEFDPADVIVPDFLPDIPECRKELAQYYGSVNQADKGLLRLMEVLKRTGHWDDTLIIYCSDNGIAFPGAKTTVYDPGIKLPFVVRNPFSKTKGIHNQAMISYVDITPTILDFADVDFDQDSFQGRSFLPIYDQANPKGWDEIYASHTFHEITMYYPIRAVRTRRYKLIWNIAHELEYPTAMDLWESETWKAVIRKKMTTYGKRDVKSYLHRPEFELYDLQKDPHEVVNLADDPGHKVIFEKLKEKIKAFQKQTADPWITKWVYE